MYRRPSRGTRRARSNTRRVGRYPTGHRVSLTKALEIFWIRGKIRRAVFNDPTELLHLLVKRAGAGLDRPLFLSDWRRPFLFLQDEAKPFLDQILKLATA